MFRLKHDNSNKEFQFSKSTITVSTDTSADIRLPDTCDVIKFSLECHENQWYLNNEQNCTEIAVNDTPVIEGAFWKLSKQDEIKTKPELTNVCLQFKGCAPDLPCDLPEILEISDSSFKENLSLDDTKANLKNMDHLITCSICTNFLIEPVTMSCSHTFCAHCIVSWVKSRETNENSCPLCNARMTRCVPSINIRQLVQFRLDYMNKAEQQEHSAETAKRADRITSKTAQNYFK